MKPLVFFNSLQGKDRVSLVVWFQQIGQKGSCKNAIVWRKVRVMNKYGLVLSAYVLGAKSVDLNWSTVYKAICNLQVEPSKNSCIFNDASIIALERSVALVRSNLVQMSWGWVQI